MKTQQKDPQIVEIVLENPAYGGDTIGRLPDGRAVFVPFALPGEKVKIRIVTNKKKYARGELVEILEPSPHRIQPNCQHFTICGGCHYQHVAYEQQLDIKHRILRDQLERIGRIENPVIEPVTPSPNKFNYRNHIQFKMSKGNKLGFFRADKNGILEIEECHLPDENINQVWPLLDIDQETGVSALGLRLGADEDILMMLESSHLFDAEFNVESLPISVVHLSPEGSQILAGSPHTIMQVKGRDFQVSAGSFFQINILLVEKMIALIDDRIPDGAGLLLELYSGVGLFSAFLAGKVDDLIVIEASETAGNDFAINLDQFDNVELYQGHAEKIIPLLEISPEIVMLDPPRTGVKRNVLERIIAFNPELIIYISCDPATLARDGKILIEGGFVPEKFVPFDFFCQTFHIETLSFWSKA